MNLKIPGKKLEHHGVKIEFIGQIGKELHCMLHILSLLKSLLTSTEFIMADGLGNPQYDYMKTRWVRIQ